MALGGGNYTVQNKKLPGAYINFVSAARATASLSERGFAAMPLVLDWGAQGVFTVTQDEFLRNSSKVFGYDYTHEKLKGLRDLFKHAQTLYAYRLNTGVKAANTFGTAKHSGIRGNDIKIAVAANADNEDLFDVKTYLGTSLVDTQTVADAKGLTNNDFVDFKADAVLSLTASTPMTGGTNGAEVTGLDWQNALAAFEKYSFNTLGCVTTTDTVKDLCVAYTKRMRDEVGVKFQCVVYKKNTTDTESNISVENKLVGETTDNESASLVYWTTGAQAGCKVNKSCTNMEYDGEFDIDTNYTQTQLAAALDEGKFMFHQVGDDIRVLEDINTLVTVTEEKGEDFKNNQTIRVIDQIGNDIAVLFNTKYLGIIPNNRSGRVSLWNDIVKQHQELQNIQAIEDFEPESVVVTQGDNKRAVAVRDAVKPINAMTHLYLDCVIS